MGPSSTWTPIVSIAQRMGVVRQELAEACMAAGRDAHEVQLIAVSKTFPAADIHTATLNGQIDFGENYAQELREKTGQLEQASSSPLRWHFIGRLQSNKIKHIAPFVHRIHALESVKHAKTLARMSPEPVGCLVAVNIGREPNKGGVLPEHALDLCKQIVASDTIALKGLMAIPPQCEDPEESAPFFEEIAALAAQGRQAGLPLSELSMGMSHDFQVAIRHGATWIRVGTAIFGQRARR